jgi:hypothetical protein
MENQVNFEDQRYFRNLTTIFDSLLLVESKNEDKRKVELAIYDVENILPLAKAGLESFYCFQPELRESGYKYLINKINEIEKLVKANDVILKDDRIRYLNIIKDAVNNIFIIEQGVKEKKLSWLGTPAEFGAIFRALIDNGYLELPSNKTQQRRILQHFFNVTTGDNEPIADRTLDDYLSRHQKSWPKGQFAIPKSENYNAIAE